MKGKDFFKWSFGLRFLFVFLCALMCVGNLCGADYIAKVAFYSTNGGVSQLTANTNYSHFCKRSYNNAIEAYDGTLLGSGSTAYVGYAYDGSSTSLNGKCKAQTGKTKSSPQNQTFSNTDGYTSITDDETYNCKLSNPHYCYAAPVNGYKFTGWTVKKGIGGNEGDEISEKNGTAPIYYECDSFKVTVGTKQVTIGRLKITTLKGHHENHGSTAIPPACQYTIIANFAKESNDNIFCTSLTAQTANSAQGMVGISYDCENDGNGICRTKTTGLSQNESKKLTAKGNTTSPNTSASQNYYVYGFPCRGYIFSAWTPGDDYVSLISDDYSLTDYSSGFKVTATTAMSKENDVYFKAGTVTGSFVANPIYKNIEFPKMSAPGLQNSDFEYTIKSNLLAPSSSSEAVQTISTGSDTISYPIYDNETFIIKFNRPYSRRGVLFKGWKLGSTDGVYPEAWNAYYRTDSTFSINYSQVVDWYGNLEEAGSEGSLTITPSISKKTAYKVIITYPDTEKVDTCYAKAIDANSTKLHSLKTNLTVDGSTLNTVYEDDTLMLVIEPKDGFSVYKWNCSYYRTNPNTGEAEQAQIQLGPTYMDNVSVFLPNDIAYNENTSSYYPVSVSASLVEIAYGDIIYKAPQNGSYTVKGAGDQSAQFEFNVTANDVVQYTMTTAPVTLTATPVSGYHFSNFYAIVNDEKVVIGESLIEKQELSIPEGATAIGADFSDLSFYVGGLFIKDLQSAIQAAQSEIQNGATSSTIVLMNDATVPAGNYTIPANVTLLLPYKDGQVTSIGLQHVVTVAVPVGAYHTLTLANGAHIEAYGTIEVSGCQTTGGHDGQGDDTPSRTGGPYYGRMHMNGGSSITLNSGSKLYAWGFVTGDRDANGKYTCEIDVRRGATVYEHFQISDWKGAFPTVEITSYANEVARHVLPICQYYIQNVEVPARYRPGSRLLGAASINVDIFDNQKKSAGVTFAMNDAGLVGIKYPKNPSASDKAVFLLNDEDNSEDTWVRKFYDPATDQQVYEINNSADVGSLVMYVTINGIGNVLKRPQNMENRDVINVDSRAYQFPIMNNFKMHLLSGDMYVTQRTEILPGAVIEIDKKATMTINNNKTNNTANDIALLFYDAEDWGAYIYKNINTDTKVRSWAYGSKLKYRPGGVPDVRDISTKTSQGNSQLIVHGTVDVKGELYTTSHGASITSTIEDAGTIIFSTAAKPTVGPTYQVSAIDGDNNPIFTAIPRVPALLRNDANNTAYGATTTTASTPKDTSYCFIDINNDGKGEWINLANDGCFVKDQYDTYYAKPAEYVALANGKTENADHTYSDAAGQGRLFIVTPDCQWWEVEKKDNLYHCINPDNDTYYYWDDEDPNDQYWREKEFFVKWVNWDGSSINWDGTTEETKYQNNVIYNLNYGIIPKYLEDGNPTRPDDVDYTYTFVGWTPEIVPVTGNATYTAVYEAIQKKYTIIFNDQNGNEIERQQLALGANPEPPTIPTGSYWNPAIAVVSGNATYQVATTPLAKYTVTWANYDGTPIYSEEVNNDGEQVPAYNKATAIGHTGVDAEGTPVKNLNNEYNYAWTGWQSPADSYDTDDELPAVSANITYTATFSVDPKKYNINFYDENNNQLGSTQNLAFGADPVVPKYSKAATAQYTYTLKWYESDPEEDAMVNVPTVTRDANYKAYFTETLNKYTVTLQSNLPGKCSFTGAGTYDYNTNVTIAATPADGYEFVKWIEREGDANLGTLPLTSDITLTAVLKESDAATPENLNVNNGEINVPAAANYMDLTIFSDGAEASGQLTGATNVTLLGNANFVFKKNIKAGYWYSFAVPWRVDAQSGVYFGGSNTPAVLGKDFEIVYYDGAVRAAQGKVDACWVYLKNLSTKKILEPGRAYMIFIKHGSQSQIVFRKKVQEPLLTTSVNVEQYNASDVLNANWNAIANPALYNAYIYAGDDPKGFYYISENDEFDWYHLNSSKLVVGEAVYIQAPEAGTIIANSSSYAAAPRRERAEQATSFDVQIAAVGATKRADHISIQIDEDKEENKYVIGKDLTKFGVSARVAQMWIDRYDVKLCFNTIAPEGDATFFPMSIYAPKAGTYTIAIEREVATDDYALYLTYNGEAIWNLSEGAYTANLNKGTDANYGLRISAKAPQVVTGVDEAVVDAKGETRKVLINNQVFIIRGENVYTIDGQLVK